MKSIKRRFEELAKELAEHPQVELLNFNCLPPLTEVEIDAFEEQGRLAGFPLLPHSVKAFYQACNGLQLRWRLQSNTPLKDPFKGLLLDWQFPYTDTFSATDGLILIQPLQLVLENSWKDIIYFDWMEEEAPIQLADQTYSLLDFSRRIRPFDCFDSQYDMAFFPGRSGEWQVVLGEDQHNFYNHSYLTDFESYLECLLATKGHVASRIHFYHNERGFSEAPLHTPFAYWQEDNRSVELEQILLADTFSMSGLLGKNTAGIHQSSLQQIARQRPLVKVDEWANILKAHHRFLQSGGAGGQWTSLLIKGLVVGLYQGGDAREGQQAQLEYRRLKKDLPLRGIELPYANCCGLQARQLVFEEANLSHSLLTDADLAGASFEGSCLQQTDFSRANLRQANFQYADLRGADFENCDLRAADFRHAQLEGAVFPGAKLEGVLR